MSNLQHAIWTLRDYNLWRRADEDRDQPDPWEIGKAIDDAIEAMEELNEWRTLMSWGGTPEIINEFIEGQQSRIYAAQDAEEQRDRLAEALKDVMKYRKGEEPYDYWRLPESHRRNVQFDGWNEIENRINAALTAVKGGSDE